MFYIFEQACFCYFRQLGLISDTYINKKKISSMYSIMKTHLF